MTTRVSSFLVTLERDLREDDAQVVLNAIRMIKCVLSVDPVTSSINDQVAQIRARQELEGELLELVRKRARR